MNIFEEIEQKVLFASQESRFKPPRQNRTANISLDDKIRSLRSHDNKEDTIKLLRNEIIKSDNSHDRFQVRKDIYPLVDIRLNICRNCKFFSGEGCKDCTTCGGRWVEWHKRVVNGTCKQFINFPEAKFLSEEIRKPHIYPKQRKVNGMFIYLYDVVFSTKEDPATQQSLKIVAQDIKSVISTLEEVMPGANLIAAPIGVPIDAIADGILQDHNTSIEQQPIMIPTPTGPMTPQEFAEYLKNNNI